MALPPPFMANAILNFHFDFLHPSLIRNAKLIAHNFFSKHKRLFFKYQVPLFVVFAVYVLSFLAEKVFAESVHKQKAIGK